MNTTLIIYAVFTVIVVCLILWNIQTERRLNRLLRGKSAKTLEDTITQLNKEADILRAKQRATDGHLKIVDEKLRHTIRNVETIRYNPFHDSGSNQSFATALLNDDGDGVIISSLYSRERVSIFAKPVKKGTPEYDLTDEEATVLKKTLDK